LFPKLITRYVTWELMKVFVISSAGFVLLMLLIGLADEARDKNIGPDIVIQLIPYLIPKALMFAMPATCLFSVCVVFGRMAAENELTAIAAMGLPKSVVVMPAIILAFALSLFAVWLNDISFAWSYWGVERVVMASSDKIIYGVLEQEGSFKTKDFSIEVAGVNDRELIQPMLTFNSSSNQGIRAIAASATMESKPQRHSVLFTMHNGFVDAEGQASYRFDDYEQHEIALKSPEQISKAFDDPGHLYLNQIGDAVKKQAEGIDQMTQDDAVSAATQWICGDLVGLTGATWQNRTLELNDAVYRHHRLHVVPHRRWANGFSCLAFAVIGIPVAMKLKAGNFATTFGVCFLPILFIYYPLFMVGLNGAKQMTLPAYGAWLGNVACLLIGGYLLIGELRK
jgi:lipopolysaccharide export system permease protein